MQSPSRTKHYVFKYADAIVIKHGLSKVFADFLSPDEIPVRLLNFSDGTPYYSSSLTSGLGITFFLDDCGDQVKGWWIPKFFNPFWKVFAGDVREILENIDRTKIAILQRLCDEPANTLNRII